MTLEQFEKRKKQIPDGPGVYFFLGKNKEVLYIGKATSLRSRVRSYFSTDLMETRGPLLVSMVEKATSIDWRETDSVLEALILEANLVRTHKPHHNTDLKDDKSFYYVVLTKEDFPRVLLVRGKNLEVEYPPATRLQLFGPFPHGMQLKEALKLVRKIFPYRDTCIPAQEALAAGRKPKGCFNQHIGLCPGVCTGASNKSEYGKTIRNISLLFKGKKRELLVALGRDMKAASKAERFEDAAKIRTQVFALTHIQDVSLIKDEYRRPPAQGAHSRIEAYDVAHLGGSAAVGVMTVVHGGLAQKNEYRKFKVKSARPGDDPGSLREILTRRLGHPEWPMPRLIVVDGSVAQRNVAESVLREYGLSISVVGVIKDEKHRPRTIAGDAGLISGRERDILLANAEAHRFAIGYHRKRSRADLGLY